MTTATPIKKAGTDKDGRLLKNRPFTPRQISTIKFIVKSGTSVTPSDLGHSKVFEGERYAVDKARRVLDQLAARGATRELKDGSFSLTAKGKRAA